MYSNTVILVRWKLTGRLECYVNLGKLFRHYVDGELGIKRNSLYKKDMYKGYQNKIVEIIKVRVKS